MKRYRIYKVLKWIFAGWALSAILFTYVTAALAAMGNLEGDYVLEETILLGVVYAVLAIFFKLQEDSNKPTVEE